MQAKPELPSLLCYLDSLLSVKIVFGIQKPNLLFRGRIFFCPVCFRNFRKNCYFGLF